MLSEKMVLKESRFLDGGMHSPLGAELLRCQQVTHQTHLSTVSVHQRD